MYLHMCWFFPSLIGTLLPQCIIHPLTFFDVILGHWSTIIFFRESTRKIRISVRIWRERLWITWTNIVRTFLMALIAPLCCFVSVIGCNASSSSEREQWYIKKGKDDRWCAGSGVRHRVRTQAFTPEIHSLRDQSVSASNSCNILYASCDGGSGRNNFGAPLVRDVAEMTDEQGWYETRNTGLNKILKICFLSLVGIEN